MKVPEYLKKGDKVAIVSPAGVVKKEAIDNAVRHLELWGLKVVCGKHVTDRHFQFAGTDADRASDLQQMLDDESIKAIICSRGGYGTIRLIEKLDFTKFSVHPKWIVGFSDITILHAHLQQNLKICSIHGQMAKNFPEKESTKVFESLKNVLFGKEYISPVPTSTFNKNGSGSGKIVGGNLSILYSLLSTKYEVATDNCILFIEDLNEYYYHIDRMLMSMKLSGKFDNLKGLIVGGMTDMKEGLMPFGKCIEELILEKVEEYNFPVCFNFSAGHILENYPIVLGKNFTLTIENGQVMLHSDPS